MKLILFLCIIAYSFSVIVFPFKSRENDPETFASPINKTKIPILKYLYHLINDIEFVSDIDVGNPRQKVDLLLNFDDNYLTLLHHKTSANPYYYNLSTTYDELMLKDPKCGLKVHESATIKEILHIKNKFYDKLDDYIKSKDEISHRFIIIFSKHLPTLKKEVTYQFHDSNAVNIGLQFDVRYNGDHGIYKPFLDEVKDNGYIENYLHFLYFFDEYEYSLYAKNKNDKYDGLFVIGKYPHELLPNKYDVKNLFWTNTFLTRTRFSPSENIQWGIKFSQVYIDYGNNKKDQFEFLRGVFDLNVEYIFPPYRYYETIKNFFRPLRKICFIDSNPRLMNKDENIYRMVYCDYEEFGKKYLKTFPKLVFKIDDFEEEFEFTYEDLFKPIYDNKYYLFLIFTGRFWRASELIIQPPSYPWTLGRLFFKKYQFVFDALNRKVGYYKNPKIKTPIKENFNNDKIVEKNDNTVIKEEQKKQETKKEQQTKEKNNLKKNDFVENKINDDNIKNEQKNEKKMNDIKKVEKPKELKKSNNIIIIIIIIISSLIIVLIIGIWYEYTLNKDKKKKQAQELIEKETEFNPENEKNV